MSKFAGRGLAVEQTVRIPILHPATNMPMRAKIVRDGKEIDVEAYVEGYSTDSRKAKEIEKANTDRRLKSRGKLLNGEEIEANRIDFLAELTTGWCIVTMSGDVIEDFSIDDARELYGLDEWRFLRDQVEVGFGDRANFIPKRPQA